MALSHVFWNLEQLFEGLADASGDLAGAFGRTDAHVFSSYDGAFSDRGGSVHRMKGGQVQRALADAFGGRSRALGCPDAHVPGAMTDVTTGA